jgi:hypothetical protein
VNFIDEARSFHVTAAKRCKLASACRVCFPSQGSLKSPMLLRHPHRHRRWIALLALLGMLFQQLAMASYACPMESGRSGSAAMVAPAAPCHACPDVDKARCQQHCFPQQPTSDHPPMPTVPALLPATTWLVQSDECAHSAYGAGESQVATRATAPPLTVQHCTFQL